MCCRLVTTLLAVALATSTFADEVRSPLTSEDEKVGIRPAFEYQQSFHPTAGLQSFYGRLWHGARISVSTLIGSKDNLLASGRVHVPLVRKRLFLELRGSYRKRSDELYAGLGMSATTPFARYGVDQGDASLTLSARPRSFVTLEESTAYGDRELNDGAEYDGDPKIDDVYCAHASTGPCRFPRVLDAAVPRFEQGTRFVRQHIGGHLDSRESELSAGNFVDLDVDYTHGVGRDASSYLRVSGRAGTAFSLSKRHVIYFSVRASDQARFHGSVIPFSELSTLGGPSDLRGFAAGRFRDQSMVLATLEYRWRAWSWLDGAVFADYGGVYGPLFKGLDLRTMRPDVGFAFFAHVGNQVVVRIQLAYGFGFRGGSRLVLDGPQDPS